MYEVFFMIIPKFDLANTHAVILTAVFHICLGYPHVPRTLVHMFIEAGYRV